MSISSADRSFNASARFWMVPVLGSCRASESACCHSPPALASRKRLAARAERRRLLDHIRLATASNISTAAARVVLHKAGAAKGPNRVARTKSCLPAEPRRWMGKLSSSVPAPSRQSWLSPNERKAGQCQNASSQTVWLERRCYRTIRNPPDLHTPRYPCIFSDFDKSETTVRALDEV